MAEQFYGFYPHLTLACPVPGDTSVDVIQFGEQKSQRGLAKTFNWSGHDDEAGGVLAWRRTAPSEDI